jgi:steroid 5-alpha reductase family enzyme
MNLPLAFGIVAFIITYGFMQPESNTQVACVIGVLAAIAGAMLGVFVDTQLEKIKKQRK